MSESPNDVDRVEIVSPPLAPGLNWQPIVGSESTSLLERLRAQQNMDRDALANIRNKAAAILGRSAPLSELGGTTGLVLGQVQSGKTISFTTVAAMARDNGYRMVIVITGTSTTLLDQSVTRLRRDLGLDEGNRSWRHINVVPTAEPDRQSITDTLAEWHDPSVLPHDRRTVLVTVMKQHQNLSRVVGLLRRLDLADVPTLIIDDEADQASLNIQVRTQGESTTYLRLRDLRDAVPRHLFLQYTATPQALLLINIIDILSPSFVEILDPGRGYHGGRAFFLDRPELVRDIPINEVPTRRRALVEPPLSLFEALRLFFLGVAAGIVQRSPGNRSMMIHPSVGTDTHVQFEFWVRETKDAWVRVLDLDDGDPDKEEVLAEFRRSEADLRLTEPSLPPSEELFSQLKNAIRRTQVRMLNTRRGRTPLISWSDDYPFILVGGSAMDRGFTVRGLTVTYMPRGLGTGMADTLQQRGRFFGYRDASFGLCRVFLAPDVRQAFVAYVEHEEDVRARLQAHVSTGIRLDHWPRAFLLDSAMRPTRDSVIDIAYQWANTGGSWFVGHYPHLSQAAIENNRRVVDQFRGSTDFVQDEGHPRRTDIQRHLVASGLSVDQVFRTLLEPFRFAGPDSQQYISTMLVLSRICEELPGTRVTVFLISNGRERKRTTDEHDRIPTLFQGAAPVVPENQRGSVYPGDDAIRANDGITVQVHVLRVVRENDEIVAPVPTLAVLIPRGLGRDLVIQPQGG